MRSHSAPAARDDAAPTACRTGPAWWVATGLSVVASFCTARAIPPWHPDATWWGAFLTSAGFGGSLAVIGAGAAAGVALHNSTRDREQKRGADELARWWDRFAWACDRAVSEEESVSRTGMAVLTGLIDAGWTRMGDDDMTVTIINLITDVGASDGSAGTPREGSRP